ncbi:MAG: threonine/serine dehydratase [Granulosicoccus sp.]
MRIEIFHWNAWIAMISSTTCIEAPDIDRIRAVADAISPHVIRTATVPWPVPCDVGGPDMELFIKMELLQRTGSFKARGAINVIAHAMRAETQDAFPGVTAFSAGNHAIATAYAANRLGTTAKVVMPRTANAFRREQCEAYGAEIVYGDTISDLIRIVGQIQAEEDRYLVHPFEGIHTIEGTATVGMELCDDVAALDAVIVPVGGGGLIAGIACAVKQMQPNCAVIGVEPHGANGMQQSLRQKQPVDVVEVDTIADSLGAPMHAPVSFGVVKRYVDEIVCVSDQQMQKGMLQMFAQMKLAVEPACAASIAALQGPLAGRMAGMRVALIGCGSNIDLATYHRLSAS